MSTSNFWIQLDIRERDLADALKELIIKNINFSNIRIEYLALALGDIILMEDNIEKIIIERKTINDLFASIKDGRYKEQSFRLNSLTIPNHNIFYLLEGSLSSNSNHQTFFSSYLSIMYYKGFSVIRTMNIKETAFFICNSIIKMQKNKIEHIVPYTSSIILNNNILTEKIENNILTEKIENNILTEDKEILTEDINNISVPIYVDVIKKIKKDNITPSNIGEIMLCCIPGISGTIANTIMKNYITIDKLILTLKENPECLNNIKYTDSGGKQRRVSQTCLLNITKFLIPSVSSV